MLVVNLMGEPSSGKSVTSAGLYYHLSVSGVKSEVIPEVAKGYAWETPKDPFSGKSLQHPIFGQQIFLLGEQNRMLERVIGKRDVAIMECPLIMMGVYAPDKYFKSFESLVLEQFNCYNNFNILLERTHSFDNDGRVHDEDQSTEVRGKLKKFLQKNKIPYITMKTHPSISQEIMELLKSQNMI